MAGKGDCGGLSWVFVRTMRASSVPARLLYGRWAVSEAPAEGRKPINGQYHVKLEFFIDGLGSVGADMSGGVGTPGNLFACFGTEAGDFVVTDLDVERRLKLLPRDKPSNIDGLQLMAWWWFTDSKGKEPRAEHHWKVEVLDRQPAVATLRPWKHPPPTGRTSPSSSGL